MALPPIRPSDTAALVPNPGDPACTVVTNFIQTISQFNEFVAWMINEDGSVTTGYLDWLGTATGTTAGSLSAPTGVSATKTRTDNITISWNSVSEAVYYRVYRGTTEETITTLVGDNVEGTSYEDTDVTADTAYWYAVRAYGSSKISALSTTAYGIMLSEEAPASAPTDFPYATKDYVFTIPAGKTHMEVLAWGPGAPGGVNSTPPPRTGGLTYNAGGGGASGAFLHVTGVDVSAGETYTVRVGKYGVGEGQTYIWRGAAGSAEYAYAGHGRPGANGAQSGAGGGGSAASSYGGNVLGSGSVDLSGGDASTPGNDGSPGSGATGGSGGAAILGQAAGGDGTNATTANQGGPGYLRVILT